MKKRMFQVTLVPGGMEVGPFGGGRDIRVVAKSFDDAAEKATEFVSRETYTGSILDADGSLKKGVGGPMNVVVVRELQGDIIW